MLEYHPDLVTPPVDPRYAQLLRKQQLLLLSLAKLDDEMQGLQEEEASALRVGALRRARQAQRTERSQMRSQFEALADADARGIAEFEAKWTADEEGD